MGRIDEVSVKTGGVQCAMTFMIVDTDSYDVLLGLDFLIKIGAIVDVERGLIQVRHGPGSDVEVLPLTVVNMLQASNSEIKSRNYGEVKVVAEQQHTDDRVQEQRMAVQTSDSNSDTSEGSEDECQVFKSDCVETKFKDTELEQLIQQEGPEQILQLTLQEQADRLMEEEIWESDDYADWIEWVADEEKKRQALSGLANPKVPTLLQIQQVDDNASWKVLEGQAAGTKESNKDSKWEDICEKLRIDLGLDELKRPMLWGVLERYRDVFACNKGELGCCTVGEHSIDTQGFVPCRATPGRLSYWEEAEVKRQIDVLVGLGKMKPSNSEYACRVTLPMKKDGSMRFCGDYRPLNLQIRRDSFPMPLVEDVISQLGKSSWFTALDLQSGFWQIRMAPEDVKKTALITKTGLYDWNVMPFGLKNATSTFTITMSLVFKELGDKFLKVFVDDLNVHSECWEDHFRHLEAVFSKLREVNLKLNPGKCCFAAKSITFLGHVVSQEGTRPDPGKVTAVAHFPIPRIVTNVRSFLGLTGYYRNYVRGYSRLAVPLFELTKRDVSFVWDLGCQRAFETLKSALVAAPVLTRPDFTKPFYLDVDWSPKGVGAILSQRDGRMERVIAYASKGLTSMQRRFHPMEGECYALIWGIMHFRQYLHRTHFTLRTDHKSLEWLATVSDANGRRGRWIDLLQDFSFKILHRPGMKHINVDALSQNPVREAQEDDDFCEEIRDVSSGPGNSVVMTGGIFSVQFGRQFEWLGLRRQTTVVRQHHECCFGINHRQRPEP
jgi:hypothetical protein